METLEIKGFRGFRHLTIGRLGRVNLIVGKNNVGKSSVLEALRLYGNEGSPAVIRSLLWSRDQSPLVRRSVRYADPELSAEQLFRMFQLHHNPTYTPDPIYIGPVDQAAEGLSVHLEWVSPGREVTTQKPLMEIVQDGASWDLHPAWVIHFKGQRPATVSLEEIVARSVWPGRRSARSIQYLPAAGFDSLQLGRQYDRAAKGLHLGTVLHALGLIASDVEQILVVGESSFDRTVLVKVRGASDPVSLKSMGDGMYRILGIILALVNARGGMMLVDEIENGIHYSVMPDLWRLILKVADELNVQVFATTHSWDCIEGFQKATVADRQNLGMLIRLERRKGEIQATLFDEEELAIATRERIEVR